MSFPCCSKIGWKLCLICLWGDRLELPNIFGYKKTRNMGLPDCLSRTFTQTVSSELLWFLFSIFFISVPCARLSWPSHQLLSAYNYTISHRIDRQWMKKVWCVVIYTQCKSDALIDRIMRVYSYTSSGSMEHIHNASCSKNAYCCDVLIYLTGAGGGRSGTMGGRSPGCFFWVLPKRSIPKPENTKDSIQQESLGTDML